ncbi:butyrate kinase [Desulfuromonas sp. TF]|uniref:butyrate kinase n=1 Tax=Desulfuromonas sp. TF TaxID=1232410 RepID=UPI00041279D0|nr:butyrate kinase [Desulfuromonas sp. TF]
MERKKKILIINPGSTSTKIALYESDKLMINESVGHSADELKQFKNIWEQYEFRKKAILGFIEKNGIALAELDALACRGGNCKPIPGGIYKICERMIEDKKSGIYGRHPANVACLVAYDLGEELNIPVFTVDVPMTDEMSPLARYCGIPSISRKSSFHALNQKATAKKVAQGLGKKYEEINMIVVHLGGGISVGAHQKGKVVDVNNALDGDGPFSPERAGSVPTSDLVKMCFSGKYTEEEILKKLTGGGGLIAHLGTTSGIEIEQRIAAGDTKAAEVYEAMAYQVAKEVGGCAAVLEGRVDAIALTGSLVHSKTLMANLRKRISFIAPIHLVPGENEMEALGEGVMRYFNGEEGLAAYTPEEYRDEMFG